MNRNDTLSTTGSGHGSLDRDDEDAGPLWRRTLSLVFTVAVVAFVVYLWPAMLGGSTRLVIVSGHSMEPTYELRDIVVVRDSEDTRIGDVVVFEIPEGEAESMLVIHRVLELDDEGFFITQGDNRTTPDQWQLTEDDIVGKPLAHIPKGGLALGIIQNTWVIALLVGLVALCLLWPDQDDDLDELDEEETVAAKSTEATDALDREAIWALIESPASSVVDEPAAPARAMLDEIDETWPDDELGKRIDADVMAEAMAWLDEQLDVDQLVSR